jgi:predicted nucleotidyltransferase
MFDFHRRTIARLEECYRADPSVLALVVVGSVARGDAHERSDVDAVLVVTDGEFARRQRANETRISANDLADYPSGEANLQVVDLGYLRAAAERGPEPTRFAFERALVRFSREAGIEQLVAAIPVYPEQERAEKLAAFASQLPVHLSYLELADYSEDPYLLVDTAHELALFGGRLILAHNRLLYPGRKHFLRQLVRAAEQPERFGWLLRRMLRHPSIPTASAFCDAVLTFSDWPEPAEGALPRYLRDRDEAWLHRPASLAES